MARDKSTELFQIINRAGKLQVLKRKDINPDRKGKVPVWDTEEDRWRVVNTKWLTKINE